MVEDEFSTSRIMGAVVPQIYVLAQIVFSLYINDDPVAPGTHLALLEQDRETQTACFLQTATRTHCSELVM
jgi:hypothetical protein